MSSEAASRASRPPIRSTSERADKSIRIAMDIMNRCCGAIAGGPRRTRPGYLLPHLAPGQTLLDVGCGPGNITMDLSGARRARSGPRNRFGRRRHRGRARGERPARAGELRGRRHLRARRAGPLLRRRARAPGAATPLRPGRRPAGDATSDEARWCGRGARRRLLLLLLGTHSTRCSTRWNELYHAIARRNQAEPDAGRFLLGWAQQAGFTDVVASSSTWTYADPESRAWWGGVWADRVEQSSFADPSRRVRPVRRERTRDHRGRVAELGRTTRRLVRGPPRRDPRPRLTRFATRRRGSGCIRR